MCPELICPLCCVSKFSDIETFKQRLIKVNSSPIQCPLCSSVCFGLDKLTIHLFGHSLPQEATLCSVVNTTQESKVLSNYSPTRENFRCEICGFTFVDDNLLRLHQNLVHNFTISNDDVLDTNKLASDAKRYSCHLCLKNFKMKGALRIHIKVAHVRFHDQNKKQINIAEFLRSQTTIHQRTTDHLELQETSLKLSSPPQSTRTKPHDDTSKSQSLFEDNSEPKKTEKSGKSFQCDSCLKTFTTKYFLKKHSRLHTG